MANGQQSVGALHVSLGLNAAQFTQSISDVNRRLRAVQSEFDAVSNGTREYAQSLQGLQAKNDMLNRQLQLQQAKVAELRRRYEESVRVKGADAKETQNLLIQYNRATGAMNRTQAQISQVSNAIADHQNKVKKAQKALSEFGEGAKAVGEKLSKTVTAPIVAMGAAMLKVADDATESIGLIQAKLGVTKDEATKLNSSARDLWKQGFGESADEATDAIVRVKQTLSGLSDKEIKEVSRGALVLSKTFGYDVNDTTKAARALMDQFGVSGTKALDYITKATQEGGDFSGELLDTITEYSVQFKSAGFDADKMFNVFIQGAKNGAFNLDKVGDAVKEFNLRAKDGSKTTAQGFKAIGLDADKMGQAIAKGGDEGQRAFMATVAALSQMKDPVKQNTAGVALFGTQWEDLNGKVVKSLNPMKNELGNVEGATKKAGDAINSSFGARVQIAWRKAQTALLPLGLQLLKLANDVLPKITAGITWVSDKFEAMSPSTQKAVLAIGGIAAVAGPAIMAIGGIASGISSVIGVVSTVSGLIGGAGGLGAVLTAMTGPVGLAVLAAGGLAYGMYKLNDAMQKPILSSDVFGDKISASTKKAVGSYLNMDAKATEALNQMAWSQETVTQKMADKLTSIYSKMNNQILASMDKRHAEEKKKVQAIFDDNNALSTAEEAKIQAKLDKDYASKKKKEQQYQSQINAIITNAKNHHRALTESERIEIAGIQEKMKTTAVKTMSKSEQEQKIILGNLKNEAGNITAEQAAKVVANSKKQRDKTVSEAKSQYKDTVHQISYMRDVLGVISSDQAKKMIAKAKEQRDKTVSNANDMHNKVVSSAKKQAGSHADQVDWETGKVLTGWQNMYNGVIKAVNWVRGIFGLKALPLKGSVKPKSSGSGSKSGSYGSARPIAAYAMGTKNHKHLGGPAIVGEEGMELAHIPNQGLTLLGTNGPELLSNLPAGSSVLPNKYTENLLKSYGFPGYAGGIGDYFNTLLKGPKALWNLAADKIGLSDNILPSWMNKWTNFTGLIGDWSKNLMDKMIDTVFGSFKGGSGSGAAQKWIMAAMKITGTPAHYLGALMSIAKHESGFNPNAINLWDSNAKAGHPSKGLFQTIDSTFNAYKLKGLGGIYDPVANAVAAIRYMNSRYGGISNVPGIRNMMGGKGYVGYATGGFINQQQFAMVGEGNKREVIIPLEQYRPQAIKMWMDAGKELGMFQQPKTITPYSNVSSGSVGTTNNTANYYYSINVEYTGSSSDQDVALLAQKIKVELDKQDKRNSRAIGVTF